MRVTVDSASWVAKLRFSERQILDALRDEKVDAITMSFHVVPAETPVTRTTLRTANRSSSAAARAIAILAASTDQPPDSAKPAASPSLPARTSVVRRQDDRLRQELLKLAARLKEDL